MNMWHSVLPPLSNPLIQFSVTTSLASCYWLFTCSSTHNQSFDIVILPWTCNSKMEFWKTKIHGQRGYTVVNYWANIIIVKVFRYFVYKCSHIRKKNSQKNINKPQWNLDLIHIFYRFSCMKVRVYFHIFFICKLGRRAKERAIIPPSLKPGAVCYVLVSQRCICLMRKNDGDQTTQLFYF